MFGAAAGAALRFSLGGLLPSPGAGRAATGATAGGCLTVVVAMVALWGVTSGTDAVPPTRARIPAAANRVNRRGAR